MGFLSNLFGMAGSVDTENIEKQVGSVLGENENVQKAFQFVRDLIIFTDRRLILVDFQGITGRRTVYQSIPYRSIMRFTVETTGHFDIDAELTLWVLGMEEPIKREFTNDKSIKEIQQALATYALR